VRETKSLMGHKYVPLCSVSTQALIVVLGWAIGWARLGYWLKLLG
jgi:hypothetical protein